MQNLNSEYGIIDRVAEYKELLYILSVKDCEYRRKLLSAYLLRSRERAEQFAIRDINSLYDKIC